MQRRRLAWSAAALLACLLSLGGYTDRIGESYAEAAFARALVTFAAARTLNGVISVAQGTEVAVEPAGVGVIFTLGQILDPINDLVERFSTVMLVATSSLGLQNVLLDITAWWGIGAILLLAGVALLLCLWWPAARTYAGVAIRLFLVAFFLRFAMPLLIIGTNFVFDTFLAAEQEAAVAALETTRAEIEAVNETAPLPMDEDASMVERLGDWIDRSVASMDVEAKLDALSERVSAATEHIINLMVIFVMQTILLPLASLWLLVELLKSLARRGVGGG
jgi:hypothetical protein